MSENYFVIEFYSETVYYEDEDSRAFGNVMRPYELEDKYYFSKKFSGIVNRWLSEKAAFGETWKPVGGIWIQREDRTIRMAQAMWREREREI